MTGKLTKTALRCLVFLLVIFLLLPTIKVYAAGSADPYSGACGDAATWHYDPQSRTLTVSGEGPMWDWHQRNYEIGTPWNKFKNEIETIRIGYGITAIGRYAFCHMGALKNLEFVTDETGFTTVEVIGGYSFCWNNTLEKVVLPEGVRFISGRAFSRVENVKEIHLPSTLESVDMYAFMSNDSSITVSKVYYNGTKEDWAQKVYVSTQGDNDKYLLPDKDTQWIYLKEYRYYTDITEYAWYADAVYDLKDWGMLPESDRFGTDEPATVDWVLSMLYIRSGSSGVYADALDWAVANCLVEQNAGMTDPVTLNMLCELICRMTHYNGGVTDLRGGTALEWCRSMAYIPAQLNRKTGGDILNRAQAASVLAGFLKSGNGYANRYDEMCAAFRTAYEAGGDGKMYILALHHGGTGKVGDSTVILMPGGETMLIDTFRSDGWLLSLKSALQELGIQKLDYLVLSHGHSDHDSNLYKVAEYVYNRKSAVGNYWSAGATPSANEKLVIMFLDLKGDCNMRKNLRAGETLTVGNGDHTVTVDILWPRMQGYNGDSNNGSLTMKLSYGESSYLTGGDLFMDGEADILRLYKDTPEILKADVMKTNHHGSYSSNGREWVTAVDPKIMITHSDDSGDSAQCHEYALDGRQWYSAGRDGGVLVVMDDKENITVTTGYDTNLRRDYVPTVQDGKK